MNAIRKYRHGKAAALGSFAYLVVMLSVQAWVHVKVQTEPESFAGFWVMLVTFPLSLVSMAVSGLTGLYGSASALTYTVAGFVQAWLIWRIFRGAPAS